jgi:aminotransferase
LGYVISSAEVSAVIRKVHDFLTVGAPSPLQEAAVTALNFPAESYQGLQADYTKRRDIFLGFLDQLEVAYYRPHGAYYVLIDITPFGFSDDMDFCLWMAKEVGIAAVPGSSFFHEPVNHLVRFSFSKSEDTLDEVGERLSRLPELL